MHLIPRKSRQARETMTLRDAMNQMFDESFWSPSTFRGGLDLLGNENITTSFLPNADVSEDDKRIVVTVELPGIDPKDIDVTLENGVLSISGETTEERESTTDKTWHRRECSYGSFSRQFALPEHIDEDGVACKAKNGTLTVTVPKKKQDDKKGKKLTVDVA